ncbi:MAG TPA: hypothetical protein VIK08_05255 [Candidatus Limnocylindrales bacterium]
MVSFRRALVAGVATLVFAGACTSISAPTIPPISIPTIPPIGLPGVGGSFPPIVLPSGLVIPPGLFPSVDASTGVCLLASPAEVSSIFGSTATVTSNDSNSCTYTFSNFATIVITTDTGDLAGAQVLFGSTAKQIQVGNDAALTGVFIGQPGVYVQRGQNQLQIQGVLTGSDDATMAKLVQVATLAD